MTRSALLALLVLSTLGCTGLPPETASPEPAATAEAPFQTIRRLSFLGEASLESGFGFEETVVGGLSALTYDTTANRYWALADDPSYRDPARIYGMTIDLEDGRLDDGDVSVESVVFVRDQDGNLFETYVIDGEGLSPAPRGGFFLSSEGNVQRGIQPSLREITPDGTSLRELTVPKRYFARKDHGVRHNLAFEALTLTPSGRWLFAGIENALLQDGPAADLDRGSPSRILRYEPVSGRPVAEYLYPVEPVPHAPAQPDGFRVNGLVELLALDDEHLLALERAYAAGTGNTVRLFLVDLTHASDISEIDAAAEKPDIRTAEKTLLLDFAAVGTPLENTEGLSHGPRLPDGRQTILLISDDNFSPRQQTQIFAFAWSNQKVTPSEIQGLSHASPLIGEWVFGVEGIVTAVDLGAKNPKAWLQNPAPDDDLSTAEGLMFQPLVPVELTAGDKIEIDARVLEVGQPGNLSVTCLCEATVRILSRHNALPEPIRLRDSTPPQFDDDGLASFEPRDDALDFFESLEGMRVEVSSAVVVGASSRFGDVVVLPAPEGDIATRTAAAGVLLTPASANPERVVIDPRLLAARERRDLDAAHVGARLSGPLVGVLDYSFGAYEVVLTQPPGEVVQVGRVADETRLTGSETRLTVGTFNVENLDALDSPEKYRRVATTIVEGLASPDLLGLQEIQDENGIGDNGTVSAAGTLDRLIEEIVSAGGPRYAYHQVDPDNNVDGGQPGANTRVAFLVNPQRLNVPRRGTPTARSTTTVEMLDDGIHLSLNPGRIAAEDKAFSFDEALDYKASRKALALEVEFGGTQLFVINAHLTSKRGDDGLYGPVQPPRRVTERQRVEQAQRIRAFVEEISLAKPDAPIIVLGDFNEFPFRAPMQELAGGDLVNLTVRVPRSERYTTNYRGNSTVLDHILVSKSLAETASLEIDIVHVNADAPASERSSDHDPVVVRLDFGEP